MSFFSFDNPLNEILHTAVQHSLGIAPIGHGQYDVNRSLAGLPPGDARKMRRKFRKMWRNFVRNPPRGFSKRYIDQLGLGCKEPTRKNKQVRKEAVRLFISSLVRCLAKEDVETCGNLQCIKERSPADSE